jgi:hypothetical protein
MGSTVFVSYAHDDVRHVSWIERLAMYLGQMMPDYELWDDGRIRPGEDWRASITSALSRANAAVLLVGPAFLRSEFIQSNELPRLLSATRERGVDVFPLIIGYCAYTRSVLEPFQSVNSPEHPLESLQLADQNRILNQLSMDIDKRLREKLRTQDLAHSDRADLIAAAKRMGRCLAATRTAFRSQMVRRDELYRRIADRVKPVENLEYEKFFFRYFGELAGQERFDFDQIRAVTEGPLQENNRTVLGLIENHPNLMQEIQSLPDLRQHLQYWLNKYDRIFVKYPEMCLLYVGVEDGVPFPQAVDEEVAAWIALNETTGSPRKH